MERARFLLACIALSACAEPARPPLPAPRPAEPTTSPRQWAETAERALDKDNFQAAIPAYQQALRGGYRRPVVYFGLAAAHMAAGDPAQALDTLRLSVDAGLRSTDLLREAAAFAAVQADARWSRLLEVATANEQRYRATHADPEAFRFVTSDIARFWTLYDQLATTANPASLLEHQYLDPGSAGLHGFVHRRIDSGAKLLAAIRTHPKYYAAIRAGTLQSAPIEGEVRAALRKFKALYDRAVFPDIYLVIGALTSGGTATPDGLIIGAEMFGRSPDVPIDELSDWLKAGTKPIAALPSIMVHEWVHFQQEYQSQSLLGSVIQEGSADFLASLVIEGNFNAHIYDYGRAHEAALKRELLADVKRGAPVNGWLYNGGKSSNRPADLGYFVGYRITEAYYLRAADKRRAIQDILTIHDFDQFLVDSGYASDAP